MNPAANLSVCCDIACHPGGGRFHLMCAVAGTAGWWGCAALTPPYAVTRKAGVNLPRTQRRTASHDAVAMQTVLRLTSKMTGCGAMAGCTRPTRCMQRRGCRAMFVENIISTNINGAMRRGRVIGPRAPYACSWGCLLQANRAWSTRKCPGRRYCGGRRTRSAGRPGRDRSSP